MQGATIKKTLTLSGGFGLLGATTGFGLCCCFPSELTDCLWAGAFAGCIFYAAAISYFSLRTNRRHLALARHLDTLSRPDQIPDVFETLPPLPTTHPYHETAEQIRNLLRDYYQRAQDLEVMQTAQEVRYRRSLAQAEQIQNVFSGLTDPIFAVDNFDNIALANAGAKALLDIDPSQAEGRSFQTLVECEKLVDLLSTVRNRKNACTRSEELELTGPDGRLHAYRATASKLIAAGEESQEIESFSNGAMVVLRDITEQKALQKRNAEFVASVSHEMKTPLAGIKAYVELLADGEAEDEGTKDEFLDVIAGQAQRLQRLVENLLNLARIEAGVVNVNKTSQSLNEVLEEAVRVVKPTAEAKNIALGSELSLMYLEVLADRDMLLQSAINLLSNAVKYTPPGGTVTMRSRMNGSQVRFEVQDNGVGLGPEDCAKVFEKFYRVKKDKDMASGTGLGLPLAKHIVEDVHSGTLTVESTLGRGSTFIVTLPGAGLLRNQL